MLNINNKRSADHQDDEYDHQDDEYNFESSNDHQLTNHRTESNSCNSSKEDVIGVTFSASMAPETRLNVVFSDKERFKKQRRLELNRISARRRRQTKKSLISELQDRSSHLQTKNDAITAENRMLKLEMMKIKAELVGGVRQQASMRPPCHLFNSNENGNFGLLALQQMLGRSPVEQIPIVNDTNFLKNSGIHVNNLAPRQNNIECNNSLPRFSNDIQSINSNLISAVLQQCAQLSSGIHTN